MGKNDKEKNGEQKEVFRKLQFISDKARDWQNRHFEQLCEYRTGASLPEIKETKRFRDEIQESVKLVLDFMMATRPQTPDLEIPAPSTILDDT